MFLNERNKSYNNHWYDWAIESIEKEALFQEVRQLVEDMIKELVPRLIEDYLKERIDTLNINVQTVLNGKANDLGNVRQDLESFIVDQIQRSI